MKLISENFRKRLQSLAGIMNEGKNHKNEYGCLMVKINFDGWKDILDGIDKDDLYTEEEGFGLEKDPHVTILFGFHDNTDVDKVKELIKENAGDKIKLSIHNITLFEAVEDKYDVLKFDVKSNDLQKLNKLVRENFDYTSDFPDYHPHITVAYVKVGKGKKYTNKMPEIEISSDKLFYSTKDEKKTYFTL